MMIIFQNKIIYMPSMPPFSRSEKVEDYANACKPVTWTEHSIRSTDGTHLKLLEGKAVATEAMNECHQQTVVVYFQGNGSSLPPRLQYLSTVLKLLQGPGTKTRYTIIALSYRGYWKSKGRPSQRGIELDAQAALDWVTEQYGPLPNTRIVLWGQSIGAAVATTALATRQDSATRSADGPTITGLLLETPFTSLRAMLIALYPQKFLPYRYLGPFLMSTWDSVAALTKIGNNLAQRDPVIGPDGKKGAQTPLRVLLLEAEDDELVPKEDAAILERTCVKFSGLDTKHRVVAGAFHTNVMTKGEGKREVVEFLRSFESTTTSPK